MWGEYVNLKLNLWRVDKVNVSTIFLTLVATVKTKYLLFHALIYYRQGISETMLIRNHTTF